MRILVVEDDFLSRNLLAGMVKEFGDCDIANDGKEANTAVLDAMQKDDPYDLIFLDIQMPKMDGQQVLKNIREQELMRGITSECGAVVIVTTILDDAENIMDAFREQATSYLVKPFDKEKLVAELKKFKLI